MAVTQHTRKVLWAQAGNRCARCETALVLPPESLGDPHAILGKECHIIARSPGGPRGDDGPRDDIDGYANLILLCGNCHDVVDTHRAEHTPDLLRRMKAQHEARVTKRGEPIEEPIALKGRDAPVRLARMTSGDALMKLVGPSQSLAYQGPDDLTSVEREALKQFTTDCMDFGDLFDTMGHAVLFDGAESLQSGIDQLAALGFNVFAGARSLTLSGGQGSPVPWLEVVVLVARPGKEPNDGPPTPRE